MGININLINRLRIYTIISIVNFKYKFNKLVDFLIPLFSYVFNFIHLYYIYNTLCVPRILPLLYDTTFFFITFWRFMSSTDNYKIDSFFTFINHKI
jgi:hypothetical protein